MLGHEGEDGEDDGELGDDDAGFDEGVDDEPRVAKQSDFGEEDAEDERGVAAVVHVVVLGEDVAGGAVADDEFEERDEDGIVAGGEDGDGGGADEDGEEGLDEIPGFRGFWLDDGEPEDVDGAEDVMDGESGGAGEEREEDDGEANDEVDKVALNVEPEIVWANGKHAPF